MLASLLLVGLLSGAQDGVLMSASAGACQLLAPTFDVAPGQEIQVPISLQDAPGLAAMELDIAYDATVVEAVGADLGPLGANMLLEVGLRKPGVVILCLATAQKGPQGDGELLTVRFRVKGRAGQASPLQFQNVRAWRSDNELEVPLEPVAGRLVVASAIPWWWIAILACGAMILLLAAVGLVRRRRRAPTTAPCREAAAAGTTCSKCGAAVAAGLKFCGQCGQAVPPPAAAQPQVCSKCGASVPPETKFCGQCGQAIAPVPVGKGRGGGSAGPLLPLVLLALAGVTASSLGAYGLWRYAPGNKSATPRELPSVAHVEPPATDAAAKRLSDAAKSDDRSRQTDSHDDGLATDADRPATSNMPRHADLPSARDTEPQRPPQAAADSPAQAEVPPREPGVHSDRHVMTNSLGMQLVLIPAGEFVMGSHETPEELEKAFAAYGGRPALFFEQERPLHRVRISRPFYLGTCEVTRGQFRKFVEETGYQTEPEKGAPKGILVIESVEGKGTPRIDPEGSWRRVGFEQTDEHPVVGVTWGDARAFCRWLSDKEGKTYRLPTEAEWEYACRVDTTTRFWCGDDPEALAWVANVADAAARAEFPDRRTISGNDGYAYTAPVGRFKPNPFGLYDMHGNVSEWCADFADPDYYRWSPSSDPAGPIFGIGPEGEKHRAFRGGSWNDGPDVARSADRGGDLPSGANTIGFRVAVVSEVDGPPASVVAPTTRQTFESVTTAGAERTILEFDFSESPPPVDNIQVIEAIADGLVTLECRSLCEELGLKTGIRIGMAYRVLPEERPVIPNELHLFGADITELRGTTAVVRVGATAYAKLQRSGMEVTLWPASEIPAAQLRQLPDWLPLEFSESASEAAAEAARQALTNNSLRQIAIAMHSFVGDHERLPPAVVYGPDGKPWHSWRIYLLPYIEGQRQYDQYRFQEPWDSPANLELLKEMPEAYRGRGSADEQAGLTHFAVPMGPQAAFCDDRQTRLDPNAGSLPTTLGRRLEDFRDGMATTILVGCVPKDRKIPWTKPEDVLVDDTPAELGTGNGFAAYELSGEKVAPFAFADGHVASLPAGTPMRTLAKFFRIAGGSPDNQTELNELCGRAARPMTPARIQLVETEQGLVARLLFGMSTNQ